MTRSARVRTWFESRRDKAAAEGIKSAEPAMMLARRKQDRERVYSMV